MKTSSGVANAKRTFKALFCDRHNCSEADYEMEVFRHCLYRHAVPFALFLAKWSPEYFTEDFGFARDLASATSRREILCEMNRFYGRNVRDRKALRKLCFIRISGKRVQRLARELFRRL